MKHRARRSWGSLAALGMLGVLSLVPVVVSAASSKALAATAPSSAPTQTPTVKAATPATAVYRTLTWANLVPMGWDPMKKFRGMNLNRLSDSNPEMADLMGQLRDALDNAPLIDTFEGLTVRLPGYVVPLQNDKEGLKEFLLVPYFGACIHMPPPPANQIVWVKLARGNKQLHSMDTVWVNGVLHVDRQPSEMGVSGYQLAEAFTEPYNGPQR